MCHIAKIRMISSFCFALIQALILTAAHAAPLLYVHDEHGTLATVNASTGAVEKIGSMGVVMTDIAFDRNGNLFGISFNDFYRIDRQMATATWIGRHNIPEGNALTFAPNGSLFAAGAESTKLFSINTATGTATAIKEIGFASGGDLAFGLDFVVPHGSGPSYYCGNSVHLYMSSTSGDLVSIADYIIQEYRPIDNRPKLIDGKLVFFGMRPPVAVLPVPPYGHAVGKLSVENMYGLASGPNGTLYGLADNRVYTINTETGSASFLSSFAGQGMGRIYGASCLVAPEPATCLSLLTVVAGGMWMRRRWLGRFADGGTLSL